MEQQNNFAETPPPKEQDVQKGNLQINAAFSKVYGERCNDAHNYKISAIRSPQRLKITYCINIYSNLDVVADQKSLAY